MEWQIVEGILKLKINVSFSKIKGRGQLITRQNEHRTSIND